MLPLLANPRSWHDCEPAPHEGWETRVDECCFRCPSVCESRTLEKNQSCRTDFGLPACRFWSSDVVARAVHRFQRAKKRTDSQRRTPSIRRKMVHCTKEIAGGCLSGSSGCGRHGCCCCSCPVAGVALPEEWAEGHLHHQGWDSSFESESFHRRVGVDMPESHPVAGWSSA